MRNYLIYFSVKYSGDFHKIYNAIKNKEKVTLEEIEEIKKKNYQCITLLDDDYPVYFRNISYAPIVLFYEGDLSLLNADKRLAIIGSRQCTRYGIEVTEKIVEELNIRGDVTIVSGLAKGIDTIAHMKAISLNMKTIAVLGSGIDICYPKENIELYQEIKERGLLISEYPPSVQAYKDNFPMRNRLISAISHAILVTEAKLRSGTQITVRHGLEHGKDIFAIPSSILEKSFCNELISQGATPVFNGFDLFDEF